MVSQELVDWEKNIVLVIWFKQTGEKVLWGVMFSLQKWKCSWSLAATIASILALVSVVHLFLYPLVPPLDYLSLSQAQNSCLPVNGSTEGGKKYVPGMGSDEGITDYSKEDPQPMVDLNVQYPADLHNAVAYRDAPWKAEVGRWLSGCDSNITAVEIFEVRNCITIWYVFTILVDHHRTCSWMFH